MKGVKSSEPAHSAAGGELPLAERIALARQLVTHPRWHALCFWNWPENIAVNEDSLAGIAGALQLHGGREGFRLGAKLCPTPQFRKKFFDFSAKIAIPTAT